MPTALELLADEALACTRCPLATQGRSQVVFGMGNPEADLMFVGEGPGAEEDRQGLPFVGRSGQLLDRLMLEELGITREHCYVANVVKCLRYSALVQLADGSWERIGRLVRDRYDGEVMSVDGSGRLVARPVVGWHASPLAGRRLFKLSFRTAKRAGVSTVNVELTGDHEVLTEKGWVQAQDLRASVRIATGQGLSPLARDVVCGTLLGDGHLNARSSHLSFSHSARQEAYARFKMGLLAELSPCIADRQVSARASDPHLHAVVMVRTRAHRALRTLAADFYAGRKRVPHWLPEVLNPRMLAIWFMDDGHLRVRPPRQPSAELATCGFSPEDLALLSTGLERLGLETTTRNRRLYFGVTATSRLSQLIAPYVPPSMRYKLHPVVAATVPFDDTRLAQTAPEVLYDEAIVTEIEHRGTDQTLFCIDVEETHNFVTAGGVVHNCRPPGNRDPLPEEIASCRPFLERQLELVDPRVVVTLGNFATRLLLDTSEGITKLRGRVHPWRPGTVLVPTLHPAAVLRGGGQAMAQARADLVRAKRALTEAGCPPWAATPEPAT